MLHKTILVVERPTHAHLVLEALRLGDTAVAILAGGFYPFEFSYPRGLSLRDFPFVGEPAYKHSPRGEWAWNAGFVLPNGAHRAEKVRVDTQALLRSGAQVVFAAGPDASGAHAFDTLIAQTLGGERKPAYKALRLVSLEARETQCAWAAPHTTNDTWFTEALAGGRAKRFFEFNFNVNALAVFGQVLRGVGVDPQRYPISKYSLQLLYWLRAQPDTGLSRSQVLSAMESWRGTGKYSRMHLGSPTSYLRMLEQLEEAGLVASRTPAHGAPIVGMTSLGRSFLECVHPDCEDPDLPGRLAQWMAAWPTSRPAVERYVWTFFGKQLRFFGRVAAARGASAGSQGSKQG